MNKLQHLQFLGRLGNHGRKRTAWTPAQLSGLALWLDAADVNTITLNGANVSQWNDKSGNNRNVSQTTASRQPAFVANSLNNNPIIAFDGTDDTLVNPGAALIRNVGGASIILVGRRRTDVASEATAVMIPTSAATRATILWRGVFAGNTGVGTGGRRLVTDSFQALGTQPYTSNYEVVISRFDYANADLRLFQNGTQTGQRAFQTAGITENDAGGLFVGANTVGSSTINLDLAEIIIVHSALSTEQRQLLEGYLAWKWGLVHNLPSNHPYIWDGSQFGYTGGITDTDAQTYIAGVEAADGQVLENATRIAIQNFIVGAKADGIWDAIKSSVILAGARTLNGALVPLKGTAPTNFNFVSGDYNRKTGLKGDGSTKYLNSNRNINDDPQDNNHISAYVSGLQTDSVFGVLLGSELSAPTTLGVNISLSESAARSRNGSAVARANGHLALGLHALTRNNSSTFTYRVNQLNTTHSTLSLATGADSYFVFRRNTTNPSYTNARLAFYSIGESLDLALLDTRVTQLITELNNVIP